MIKNLFEYLYQSTNSQFVQGTIFAGLLTGLYGLLRIFFPWLGQRFRRMFVFTMTIEQTDELYVLVDKYIAEKYPGKLKNVEAFLKTKYEGESYTKVIETNDDDDHKNLEQVKIRQFKDYIIIRYKNNFLKITKDREKLDGSTTMFSSFMGSITITGFMAKNQILELIKEINNFEKQKMIGGQEKIVKYSWNDYSWRRKYIYQFKGFDNLYFDSKQMLINRIDFFENNKNTFLHLGLDWHLGILIYGKPGTGKTSIAKAIAKYTNRNLYTMNLSNMTNSQFILSFNEIGNNACILFDDVDINIPGRENKEKDQVSLQSLLSFLDGAESRSDIIIMMTTNYIEKLDPALIREGRIDFKFEMKEPNKKNIEQLLTDFYGEEVQLPEDFKINKTIPIIQNICLYNDLTTTVKLIQE